VFGVNAFGFRPLNFKAADTRTADPPVDSGGMVSSMRMIKGLHLSLTGDDHRDQPIYRRIYLRLREAIEDGVLMPGIRLPSTRTLAADLGVSRNTIAAAFDQLHADGYLRQRVGDGTYVAPRPPGRPAHVVAVPASASLDRSAGPATRQSSSGNACAASLAMLSQRGIAFDPSAVVAAAVEPVCMLARPGIDLFPRGLWRQVMNDVIGGQCTDGFDVCDPAGHPTLRKVVARHLSVGRGLVCDASQIIITTSGLQAVDLAVRVITDAKDQAWMEDPGCNETRGTMTSAGLEIIPVPVDSAGLDVEHGRNIAPRSKLAYVTPGHQFPTGVVMSIERRKSLVDWADWADAWIIEDEFDGDLLNLGRSLPAIQSLRGGRRTIYVGHFGLSLFPSVGVGYMVVPAGAARRFAQAKRMIDGPASALNQLAVARFIDCGFFDAHIRHMRHCYAKRRQAILQALCRETPFLQPINDVEAGVHLTLALSAEHHAAHDDRELMAAATVAGHQLPAISAYTVKHQRLQGLVLGYAGIPASHADRVAAHLAAAFQATASTSARYA